MSKVLVNGSRDYYGIRTYTESIEMHTISANAKSYLEDDVMLLDVEIKPRGRRFSVRGKPADVAKVIAAGEAVDRWLRANAAMQRKYERQYAAAELALSNRLARDLRGFKRRTAKAA
jgi:hypothetical protein